MSPRPAIYFTFLFLVTFLGLGLLEPTLLAATGGTPKVGVVDMNRALNVSRAGQRSKNLILASKTQKENELKKKEEELKKLRNEIQNNILLTEAAKAEKEKEIRRQADDLRNQVQIAQRDLQQKERTHTQSIFTDLKTVISLIAKEEKFDFVLDKGASQVILFSNYTFVDITDKVIQRYDSLNK